MKWIQHFAEPGLSDAGLRDYIRQSHAIVAQGLSKKKRIALRLAPGVEMKPPGGARAPRRKQNRV